MSTLNDDTFARLVAEEVKNKVSRAQREVLMQKENWGRWKRALEALIGTLDEQLDNLDDDEASDIERYTKLGNDGKRLLAEATADYKARKNRIERFKFHVQRKLDDVEQMMQTGELRADASANAILYENAIKKHRSMIEQYDIEPTAIDLALWEALDGKWAFNQINPNEIIND